MTKQMLERIAAYIRRSDLPRKERKLDGLHAAYHRRIPLTLSGETLLHDGVAIDPSELENGYWL